MDHRRSLTEAPEAASSETRRGTVLFADIRGFTTLSERLFPGEVADLLKNFFDQACQPILKQGGWVVRFIGDGILAMFESAVGSPPDDSARALRAASLMVLAARQFNSWLDERLPGRNLPEFAIGVGVHTGDVAGALSPAVAPSTPPASVLYWASDSPAYCVDARHRSSWWRFAVWRREPMRRKQTSLSMRKSPRRYWTTPMWSGGFIPSRPCRRRHGRLGYGRLGIKRRHRR